MDLNQSLDNVLLNARETQKHAIELISLHKFILFNLLSFGLYGIWWMYKSWRFFRKKEKLNIIPAGRALFAIFFANVLFEKILKYARANGYRKNYSSPTLFFLFILLIFSLRLPPPYWLLSFLAFLPLIQPFQALNFAISNSSFFYGQEKSGLNFRQIALVIIGIISWTFVLLGFFL
jgi:hypothetical protein